MNTCLAIFVESAEAVICDGLKHALQDDPHLFATLPSQFDDSKARPQLVIDFLAGGQVRIKHLLIGLRGGDENVIEVFTTLVQSAAPGAAH